MKNDQAPKEKKYGLVVCSIIGRKGAIYPSSWVNPILNHSIEDIKDKYGNGWKKNDLRDFLSAPLPCILSDEEKKDKETISKEEFEKLEEKPMPHDWENCPDDEYTYSFPLLGEYDWEKKKIILYRQNIKNYSKYNNISEEYLAKYVYTHELFHALFHYVTVQDADRKHSRNYIREIEEAITEFCTLVFLKDFDKDDILFQFAKKEIEKKQEHVGILAAYGFGAYLYDNLKEDKRYDLINKYIKRLGNIIESDCFVEQYKHTVRLGDQEESMRLLYTILNNLGIDKSLRISYGSQANTKKCNMKEIVISRMYSGEYLDTNLGHEVINLFKADDGKHYIYLNHDGRYGKQHVNNGKLTFDRILFVKPIGDNAVEVVAKAEGLTMLYDPTKSVSDNRNTQLSCNISYGGCSLQRIFFGAAQQEVNVTFEADKVLTPTQSICLEFALKSNAKNARNHQQEYDNTVTLKDTKLGQGLKNYVPDNSSDFADLQHIMNDSQLWADTIQKVDLKALAASIPQTTYLDICGHSYDEVAYSNAIAHFMGKYPKLVKEWINTSFSSTDRPFQPCITFAGDILNVKREWGNSTGRVDILFYVYNSFLCAIENKLLSTLSDLQYDANGHVIKSQLDKYYDILQEFENQNISANNSSQINMPHGIHILLPDYHPLLRHLDSTSSPKPYLTGQPPVSTKYDTLSGYIVIRYSQVYNFLLPYLKKKPYKDDALFVEFVHSLERHTHEQEDGRYWDMVRQFVNKIQNNPIP